MSDQRDPNNRLVNGTFTLKHGRHYWVDSMGTTRVTALGGSVMVNQGARNRTLNAGKHVNLDGNKGPAAVSAQAGGAVIKVQEV